VIIKQHLKDERHHWGRAGRAIIRQPCSNSAAAFNLPGAGHEARQKKPYF